MSASSSPPGIDPSLAIAAIGLIGPAATPTDRIALRELLGVSGVGSVSTAVARARPGDGTDGTHLDVDALAASNRPVGGRGRRRMTRRHRGAASESDEVARRWWTLPWSALPVAADRPTLAADQSPGSGFYNTTTGAAPAPTTAPGDSPLTRPGGPVPTPEPMLPPRRFKPVAESLMRRPPEPSGFDVPASVERIARGIPILEWPSQLRRRAAGRVLVLLDHNENMQATAADGVALAAWLATVAGGSLVTTARFRGDPKARGGPDWSAFDRVIVFGSFGAALPILAQSRHEPDAATWLRYARAASRQGTDVVAVVPFDRDRVAAPLVNGPGQRLIAVVPWSEATSVRDVHRSVGRLSGATRG